METKHISEDWSKVKHSLQPYIKKREEVTQIRRVLGSYLEQRTPESILRKPLALAEYIPLSDPTCNIPRCMQKDLLRCRESYCGARHEYVRLSRNFEHVQADVKTRSHIIPQSSNFTASVSKSFLDLIRLREKHERLNILSNHINLLNRKSLESNEAFGNIHERGPCTPQMPEDILNVKSHRQLTARDDLTAFVEQLEKSVVKAKVQLGSEQMRTQRIHSTNQTTSSHGEYNKLQALSTARNELINWIESRLEKSDSGSLSSGAQFHAKSPEGNEQAHIDARLKSIRLVYSHYVESRKALIATISESLATYINADVNKNSTTLSYQKSSEHSSSASHRFYPYLLQLISMSNQQKYAIQQKAYLSITLTKQLKESNLLLNRLADESHLLPAHRISSDNMVRVPEGPTPFGLEMASLESSNLFHRAQSWAFAAASAAVATRTTVSERLEEGGMATLNAQEFLLELLSLIGEDADKTTDSGSDVDNNLGVSGDIWARFEGKLGVITKGHDE